MRLLLMQGGEQWQALQRIRSQLAGLNRIVTLEAVDPMGLQPRLKQLDEWLPEHYERQLMVVELPSKALATIVYTSGTTGRSKGVMLSHRNILWNIEAGLKLIDVYPSDRFLSFLPLSHTLERTVGYYLPLVVGASIIFVPRLWSPCRASSSGCMDGFRTSCAATRPWRAGSSGWPWGSAGSVSNMPRDGPPGLPG